MSEFGQRLRAIRKSKGLTQEELCKLAKIPNSTVSKFEQGDRKPSYVNLLKLVTALNVSADKLLGLK